MTKTIDDIIDMVLASEGGYGFDPADAGGETMHGITKLVARNNGYRGEMIDLPVALARSIYRKRYVEDPGFDKVAALSHTIAAELTDTGVNMGPARAAEFLQRWLNGFNVGARYPDLVVDGAVGPKTLRALAVYLEWRGAPGERALLAGLNASQGARYLDLAEAKPSQRKFLFGWISQRVSAIS